MYVTDLSHCDKLSLDISSICMSEDPVGDISIFVRDGQGELSAIFTAAATYDWVTAVQNLLDGVDPPDYWDLAIEKWGGDARYNREVKSHNLFMRILADGDKIEMCLRDDIGDIGLGDSGASVRDRLVETFVEKMRWDIR